jgi:hypothetical protein
LDAKQLKDLQAPLKQKCREEPQTALIRPRARARLGTGITCKVET